MTGPRRVAALRREYLAVLCTRVSDQADAETQHAWWRIHDAAKRDYARADWQWESLVLRVLIALVLALALLAFVLPVTPIALIAVALTLAQCYRIFMRHAPD